MDGENERERTSKDIFIRIILQPRISSGKVAQCLPITQTRRHRHTQTQCRRRLQKLEKLYFTSVCPGKPLFKAAQEMLLDVVTVCVCTGHLFVILTESQWISSYLILLFIHCVSPNSCPPSVHRSQEESLDSSLLLCIL